MAFSVILSHPTLAMSYSQVLVLLAMSHNSPRKEEMLEWLLTCPWHGLPGQDDLLREEAGDGAGLFYAISKYIELVTLAGAEVCKNVGMVLEGWRPGCPGLGIRGQAGEDGGVAEGSGLLFISQWLR